MASKSDTFHIIIAGDSGAGRSFTFSRRRLRNASLGTVLLLLLLGIGSWQGLISRNRSSDLAGKLAETHSQLDDLTQNFTTEIDRKADELASVYQARIELLSGELNEVSSELDEFHRRHADTVQHYEHQLSALRQDQEKSLEQSISKLNERSQAIESMMNRIGITVKSDKNGKASGGPYIAVQPDTPNKLLQQSGRYLEILKSTPLGQPVSGRIGSGFGRRTDPFTNKEAFHSGIDFEGKIGTPVFATAEGVVTEVAFDKGGYGHFVRLRHGNGYETLYAHLLKPEVVSGQSVKRGQNVGQLGNSGRSTGPHLHYEIIRNGAPIDPAKFLAADTSRRISSR